MQDADPIVAECRDLIAGHPLAPELMRGVVAKAMLGEQPLPSVGRRALWLATMLELRLSA